MLIIAVIAAIAAIIGMIIGNWIVIAIGTIVFFACVFLCSIEI